MHTIETRNRQCKRQNQRGTWESFFNDKELRREIQEESRVSGKKNPEINYLQISLKMTSEK
jgi:hypothetical protein